jgi:hypothetical protein
MTNQKFGLKTGGEAVYYPETNTIGLPGFYLAGPTDKPDSPKEWGVVQRGGGGGGGGGGIDMSSFGNWGAMGAQGGAQNSNFLSGLMAMLGMGGAAGAGAAGAGAAGAGAAGAGAAGAGAAGVGTLGASGMGGSGDGSSDPGVQQVIQQVTAQGGKVIRADKNFVLADMNKGQGPQWLPVGHQHHHGHQNQASTNNGGQNMMGGQNMGWLG